MMSDRIETPLIPDCSACIVNSMKILIPLLAEDETEQNRLFSLVFKRISEGYRDNLPPIILSIKLHQELYKVGGVENPYAEIKRLSNEFALKALPRIEKKIHVLEGYQKLRACLAASIAGNVIDYNTGEHSVDLEALVEVFDSIQTQGFDLDDSEYLWRSLKDRTGNLLYLADNAGEVILDIPFLRFLKELGWKTTYVVKGRAMINDATEDDVRGTEIEELATITNSGAWAHGVPKEYVSKEFLQLMAESDIVVSKGQANIETVPEIQRETSVETYYVTKAKCSHISQAVGAKRGDNVVLRRPKITA
ncbi:MAG: damage-control phosphatase ARMT1 family protein [Candidatus Thorarchaeota archaeon]